MADPITVPGEDTDDPQVVAQNLLAADTGNELANILTGTSGTDGGAPVTDPSQIAADAAPQAPQLAAVSGSVRVKDTGFGPDMGQAAMRAQGMGEFAQEDQRLQSMRDDEMGRTTEAYNAEGQAELDHGAVEKALYEEQARHLQETSDFQRDAADADRVMYAQTKAETAQYLDAYKQQLAAVRQMTVVDPRSTLSKMQAGGLSLAMFSQGFLAARGIQIDVAGQVDRWVAQSLHEQETNIQLARESANDQLNLYNIARQTSQDDLEAFHRYRGMVVEAMKTGIDAAAAKFNAPLAASAAQVAKAKLDVESTNSLNAIGRQYEAARLDNLKAMRAEIHTRIAERQRSHELAISEALKNAQIKKLEAASAPKAGIPIKDPGATTRDANGKVVGTKVIAEIDPNIPDGMQSKAQEITAKEGGTYATIKNQLATLRALRAPAMDDYTERFGGSAAKHFSEDYRKYKRQKDLIGEQLITSLTGAAAPEQQMKRITGILADDSEFQKGSNQSGLIQLEKWSRDNFISKINNVPGVRVLSPDKQYNTDYADPANDTDSAYNAELGTVAPKTSFAGGEAGKAAMGSADQEGDYRQNTMAWDKFIGSKHGGAGTGEAEYAQHIDALALGAIKPELLLEKHPEAKDSPEDIQRGGLAGLQSLAVDNDIPPLRRKYAAHVLERLQKDPDALLRDLTTTALDNFGDPEKGILPKFGPQ